MEIDSLMKLPALTNNLRKDVRTLKANVDKERVRSKLRAR